MSDSVADDMSDRELIEFSEDEHLTFFFNIDQVYGEIPGVIQNYGTFAQSLQICRQLSNLIIKNSIADAQERFILRNIPINAINEIEAETTLLLNAKLNDGGIEVESCDLIEDQEPEPIFCDRWRRNRIQMMIEEETNENDQNDEKLVTTKNVSKLYDIINSICIISNLEIVQKKQIYDFIIIQPLLIRQTIITLILILLF